MSPQVTVRYQAIWTFLKGPLFAMHLRLTTVWPLLIALFFVPLAKADVTSTGTYSTNVPIDIPPAPGAPKIALEYNSASRFGLAGAGWDISLGWPTLIVRDTRFGTPAWKFDDVWLLGNSPLISTDSGPCSAQTGSCSYRTAPDSLVTVTIDFRHTPASAKAIFPNGMVLTYEPIEYDGQMYPPAPAGRDTDIFGFLLRSAQDSNGYLTCFVNKHWGDKDFGRLAVLTEIQYGPVIKDCNNLPKDSNNVTQVWKFHHVVFDYEDPSSLSAPGGPYFTPMSFRMGAPVSYNNLLTKITTKAADFSSTTPHPAATQLTYSMLYQLALSTETRTPLLQAITEQSGAATRTIRYFNYGARLHDTLPDGSIQPKFGPAQLLDVGDDSRNVPPSLRGSEMRPIRQPFSLSRGFNLFQSGNDQIDPAAPVGFATREQWSLLDINGDGLLDTAWAKEGGFDSNTWPTYEQNSQPLQTSLISSISRSSGIVTATLSTLSGSGPLTVLGGNGIGSVSVAGVTDARFDGTFIVASGSGTTTLTWMQVGQDTSSSGGSVTQGRPPQQEVMINEGISGGAQKSTTVIVQADAPSASSSYNPTQTAGSGRSNWIWEEGLGKTRTGMPVALSTAEIRGGGDCSASLAFSDTRKWPYLPDGSLGGSTASIGENVSSAVLLNLGFYGKAVAALQQIANGYLPRRSSSVSVSDWVDMDGDGILDWVVTPGMIQNFDHPCADSTLAVNPYFTDQSWYVASGSQVTAPQGGALSYTATPVKWNGTPKGLPGLPLSFSDDSNQADTWGLTLPIGSVISHPTAVVSSETAILALAADALTPRAHPGFATFSLATPSARGLMELTLTSSSVAGAVESFLMSEVGNALDFTVVSAGNDGRNQSRSQLMDFNADGYPDYLLYDSEGLLDPNRKGDIVLFLNNGSGNVCPGSAKKGEFCPPKRINAGYDYSKPPDIPTLIQDLDSLSNDAETLSGVASVASLGCDYALVYYNPACYTLTCVVAGWGVLPCLNPTNIAGDAKQAASKADFFLQLSTDALPGEQSYTTAAKDLTLATFLLSFLTYTFTGPDKVAVFADATAKATTLIDHAVRQVGFPSRLNLLAKSMSHVDQTAVGNSASGKSYETAALIDLNGDGLPDYVITTDRDKQCGSHQWAVYWGTGTSNLSSGQGFTSTPTCIDVPNVPVPDGVGPATTPLQIDVSSEETSGLPFPAASTVSLTYSYASLMDFNQDGRPDLVVADQPGTIDSSGNCIPNTNAYAWKNANCNTWTVYLNNGHGFDLDKSRALKVKSVSAQIDGVSRASNNPSPHCPAGPTPRFDVPFPSLKSSYEFDAIDQSRADSWIDAAFVDIEGNGTADLAQRVQYHDPAGGTTCRAGILYWSRAGSAPQDLMIENRDPVAGSRLLINYLPSSRFQWTDGIPNGSPPPRGHARAIGQAPFLVSSVVSEPLLGRATKRAAAQYDYKDPYFDQSERGFAGYANITKTPLDPQTSTPITASTSTSTSFAQLDHARDGATHIRTIDNLTGVLVSEMLQSYEDIKIINSCTSCVPGETHLSKTSDVINEEFPSGLTQPPALDVSFDGRNPLANKASTLKSPLKTSDPTQQAFNFDARLPTGGGIVLDRMQQQWIEYMNPLTTAPSQLTIELWLNPQRASAVENIVGDDQGGYSISLSASGEVLFTINSASQGAITANGGVIPANQWSHILASYDGAKLRVFINTVLKNETNASGQINAGQNMFVGCASDSQTHVYKNCFSGSLGELRIYPEGWTSPPRITRDQTSYDFSVTSKHFGMQTSRSNYGDIATDKDDVYQEISYANPQVTSQVGDAVSSIVQRTLQPDGTKGCYLGYSETSYDSLPVGQVAAGNPTGSGVYSGTSCVNSQPASDTFTDTAYTDPNCPGKATEIHDPLGAVTRTTYDPTCTFVLTKLNDLGHLFSTDYFGVYNTGYVDTNTAFAGLYGQTKSTTDANGCGLNTSILVQLTLCRLVLERRLYGASTLFNYDEFGRLLAKVGPNDTISKPGTKNRYADAQCDVAGGRCDFGPVTKLVSPPQLGRFVWDDMQHKYRATYEFSDGQVQTQAVNFGTDDWVISGTRDYDALGRTVTTYKQRYLSTVSTSSCPSPGAAPFTLGTWCDAANIGGVDPLRDPSTVAHIQTAYDHRGRVVRIYGPDVPACLDPSAVGSAGLLCDVGIPNGGHVTKFQYPAPGKTRTIDALNVPTVVQKDVHGRTQRVEEYVHTSAQPYSTADYGYDPAGNLTSIIDSNGNTSSAIYDALGRKTSNTDPDMGTWTYAYDKRGELKQQFDAAGGVTENDYDSLGRLLKTKYMPTAALPSYLHYSFDGQPGDSETTNPVVFSQPIVTNLWRIGSQFSNQRQFSQIPHNWDQNVPLTPLPLLPNSTIYGGVAPLPLPFDFALTPDKDWCLETPGRLAVVVGSCDRGKNLWLSSAGDTIWINTNGKIRLDSAGKTDTGPTSGANRPLPTPDGEIGIYPFWTNLVMPNTGPATGISYAILGSRPYRRLIIQWDGAYANAPGTNVEFRVVLYETSSEIQYQYNKLPLGSGSATIGLQNKTQTGLAEAEAAMYSFNQPAVNSNQALSSLQTLPTKALQFNNGAYFGVGQGASGAASFDVDLTDSLEAALTFRNSWNTRCIRYPLDSCPVDRMEVDFDIGQGPQVLVPETDLITDRALNAGLSGKPNAPLITVQFPQAAIGKKVMVSFVFSSLDSGTNDPSYGWIVSDINIAKRTFTVEDEVIRSYDSGELTSSYLDSNPVLDLTFDVPDRVEDRSPWRKTATIQAVSVESDLGISGKAAKFEGNSAIYADNDFPPFGQELTVELWVNPSAKLPSSPYNLILHPGDFALTLEPGIGLSWNLGCYVFINGHWQPRVLSAVPFPVGTWTHLAMTYDSRPNQNLLSCYVDGRRTTASISGPLGYAGVPMTIVGPNAIVGGINKSTLPFSGLIDEVRVFSKVRTSGQIISDMMSPLRHGPPRGNVLDLRFSDESDFLTDSSGAANNAALAPGRTVYHQMLPGIEGNASIFHNISSEFVQVKDAASLRSDLLTAETWVKTSTSIEALLIGKWHGVAEPGWRLMINNLSGQVRFEIVTTDPNSSALVDTSFVTLKNINDGAWHHVAGVYDGTKLVVYIDGIPQLRTCTSLEGGDALTCKKLPVDKCSTVNVEGLGNAVCVSGSIINRRDVFIGNYDPDPSYAHVSNSLDGMLDEVRLSNYAKCDFEMAESARQYSVYTQLLGRQVEMRNTAEEENSSYDLLGREVTNHKFIDTGSYIARKALDALGRTASLRYPDGEVAVSQYDSAGTQTSLVGYGNFAGYGTFGQQVYLTGAGVNVANRLAYLQFGNCVSTSFKYNDLPTQAGSGNGTFGDELLSNVLTRRTMQPPTCAIPPTTFQNQTYTYDPVGNLFNRTDTSTPLHGNPLNSTYSYDDLDRLIGFQTNYGSSKAVCGSSSTVCGTYVYDPLGNLTTKDALTLSYGLVSNPGNCGKALATSLPHAVVSVINGSLTKQYCYDENGRIAQIQVGSGSPNQVLTHYVMGKLSCIKQQTSGQCDFRFDYDGNGKRVRKVEPAGTTVEPFEFYRVTPSGSEKYYFKDRRLLVRRVGSQASDVFWYHPDHLGGTNVMTSSSGDELQDAYSDFYPYGTALPNAANNTAGTYSRQNTPDPAVDRSGGFQFTGHELDSGSSLYFYDARYLAPDLGRFIEPDDITRGQAPQTLNRYSYVRNNPLRFTDPSGHDPEPAKLRDAVVIEMPPLEVVGHVEPQGPTSEPTEWNAWPEPLSAPPLVNAPWFFVCWCYSWEQFGEDVERGLIQAGSQAYQTMNPLAKPVAEGVQAAKQLGLLTDTDIEQLNFVMLMSGMEASAQNVGDILPPANTGNAPGMAINLFGEGELAEYGSLNVNNMSEVLRPEIRGQLVIANATELPFGDNSLVGIVAQRAPGQLGVQLPYPYQVAPGAFGTQVASEAFRTLQPGRIFGIYSISGGPYAWLPYLRAAGFEQVQVWGQFAVGVRP